MYILLLILFLAYVLVAAILGYRNSKKIIGKEYTKNEKIKNYRIDLIASWIPVFVLIPIFLFFKISLHDIGFRLINFNYNIWFSVITLIISVGAFAHFVIQMIAYLVSEKHREKIKIELLKPENELLYNIMLPHNIKEKKYWFCISLTAGICEEIIFRGLFLFILQGLFPNLSIVFIIIIAIILFGLGHLYQGIGGVIKTALVGAIFTCLYLVTNSLFLVIFLHFIIDFSSAFLIKEEKTIENKV